MKQHYYSAGVQLLSAWFIVPILLPQFWVFTAPEGIAAALAKNYVSAAFYGPSKAMKAITAKQSRRLSNL